VEDLAGIAVDFDRRCLAGAHVGELAFLEIRLDPDILRRDQREQRVRCVDVVAHLQLLDFGDDPTLGCVDHGVGEIQERAIKGRARLQHGRMRFD
jgi:hypothetical protein